MVEWVWYIGGALVSKTRERGSTPLTHANSIDIRTAAVYYMGVCVVSVNRTERVDANDNVPVIAEMALAA